MPLGFCAASDCTLCLSAAQTAPVKQINRKTIRVVDVITSHSHRLHLGPTKEKSLFAKILSGDVMDSGSVLYFENTGPSFG